MLATMTDADHKVALFDVKNGYKLIGIEKSGNEETLDVVWMSETEFIIVGNKKFVTGKVGESGFKLHRGSPGDQILIVAVKNQGDMVTGNGVGELGVWKGASSTKTIQAHKGALEAIAVAKER